MFLSFSWCIFCELDVNSEHLRCLGSSRYEVYFIWCLLNLRHYPGKFILNGAAQLEADNVDEELKEMEIDDQFKHILITNTAFTDPKQKSSPHAKVNDGYNDFTLIRANKSRC